MGAAAAAMDSGDLALLLLLSLLAATVLLHLLLLLCRHHALLRKALATPGDRELRPSREVEVLIQQKLRQCQTDLFRSFCQALCFALLPFTLHRIFLITSRSPRLFTHVQECVHVTAQLLTAAAVVRPRLLTAQAVNAAYLVLMLLVSLCIAPFAVTEESLLLALLVVNPPALLATTIQLNLRTTLLPMLAFACLSASSIWQTATLQPKAVLAAFQFLLLLGAAGCAALYERSVRRNIWLSMQFQECREQQSATAALLRSSCDVVLELDGEGSIVRGAADVAKLLLRGASVGLQAAKLVDYVEGDEKKEQLEQRLSEPRLQEIGLAETMRVAMKDGNGTLVPVELLWVQFKKLDCQTHCMLGLRELPSDGQRHECGCCDSGAVFGEREWRSESSGHLSLPEAEALSIDVESGENGAARLVVDATVSGFPVRSFDQGFARSIGRLKCGAPLLTHVKNGDGFRVWLEQTVNEILHGGSPQDIVFKLRMSSTSFRCVGRVCLQDGDLENVVLLIRTSLQLEPKPAAALRGTPSSPAAAVTTTTLGVSL